ncbi:hypothetical protein [Polyangium spumosum]|uniref:Uncharacterized protein n=1 Tax=Polyangium spumosum TaxID=889282 RepID=A0A6N7PU09_9BACT|nr:hypothetical protein [Polyangium spumosum]MRG95538.1 hypothetical protein [Polyangium spumosum]
MGLAAQKLEKRRGKSIHRATWHRKQPQVGKALPSLDELERQINAMHDEVAALLHERNARPKDAEVKAKLEAAIARRRQLQIEYADRSETECSPEHAATAYEDSELVQRAMKLVEYYEGTPADDTTTD